MKYIVDIGGERMEVELDGETARIGDISYAVHLADVEGTPVHLVAIGDRVHRVVADRAGERGRYTLRLDGWRIEAEALDERARAIRDLSARAAAVAGPRPVTAPMPGMRTPSLPSGLRICAGRSIVLVSLPMRCGRCSRSGFATPEHER